MFRVVSIMFSFLSIKIYVCTWVNLLFVNKKKVFKEDERAFENFDKNDVIKLNITHILRILLICQNGVEQLWRNFQGPWQGSCPWTKQCIHFENLWKYQIFVAWLLKSRALENIHKTHVFDPNNVSTLRILEHVKRMLVDYQETLEDLEIHAFIYMPPPLFYKYVCGIRLHIKI